MTQARTVSEILEELEPALAALKDYDQMDEDGVIVATSRQAIHVVSDAYPALREEIERLRGALAGRELEWSPFSDAPQDGRKLIVGSIAKFTPYKEPKKQGRKGRWQIRDEYGKWRNIDRTADHFIAGYKPDRRTLKGDEDNG